MHIRKPSKILWFTNTPSLAESLLNVHSVGGGWIKSLEEKFKDVENINLAIAFKNGDGRLEKFGQGNTTYYRIPNNNSRLQKLIQKHLNKLQDHELTKYCLEVIHDFKPDIINVFGTEDGFGMIIDRTKIPVVIHIQGILTVYKLKWFSSKISIIDLLIHSTIKSLLLGESLIHDYLFLEKASRREKQIFKISKFLMGRTDWDRRVTAILAPNAQYFNNGELLRKEFYGKKWNKTPEDTKLLISTIQANIYKGLETILESSALLKRQGVNFKWLVAGISQENVIVKIFEGNLGKRFVDSNVTFLGKVEAMELVKIELAADVFIHPSHIDNSSNSICEAMLLGMPVIATYAGGTSSLLIDKKEGILIQDGDPYSMSGAILELINDPLYSARLGQNAQVRAMKRHHDGAIVERLLNIYSLILAQ